MTDRLVAEVNRELTADQARAYLDQPITQEERDGVLGLVRWFRRRYPTPAERLAYARRAHARWSRPGIRRPVR
jgi:hypothetical protein